MRLHLLTLITCLGIVFSASAQQSNVLIGVVRGDSNEPLNGASVFVENQENRNLRGAATDNLGQYTIEVPSADNLTVVFACIGYESKRIPYNGQSTLNVTLVADEPTIEEVVVKIGRA